MKAVVYDWGGLNVALFHLINGVHAQWIDQIMLAFTWAGAHERFSLYVAAIAVASLIAAAREPGNPAIARLWLLALAAYAAGYLIDGILVTLIKSALDFPRPPLALPPGEVIVVGAPEYHHSLPSGHASFAALTGAALWIIARGTAARIAICGFVACVCLSRIYLGAHFPADTVFGAAKSLLLIVAIRSILIRIPT